MGQTTSHTIVNQPFGIGDVIWSQTVVREVAEAKRIVWGVFPQYVEALSRAYTDISFIDHRLVNINYDRRDEYVMHGARVLPIRHADTIIKKPYNMCMRAKYDMYGVDWQRWKLHARWRRDIAREKELLERFAIDGDYNLVNNFAGTELQLKGKIAVDNGLPTIDMRKVEDYTLFDWATIIENAAHIYTISTSIIYLLEMLDLKAKEVHYYLKPNEADFSSTDYILAQGRHKYIYHK